MQFLNVFDISGTGKATVKKKSQPFLDFEHKHPCAVVTKPLCLVESHMLDAAARRERSLFTSLTFCKVWAVAL